MKPKLRQGRERQRHRRKNRRSRAVPSDLHDSCPSRIRPTISQGLARSATRRASIAVRDSASRVDSLCGVLVIVAPCSLRSTTQKRNEQVTALPRTFDLHRFTPHRVHGTSHRTIRMHLPRAELTGHLLPTSDSAWLPGLPARLSALGSLQARNLCHRSASLSLLAQPAGL